MVQAFRDHVTVSSEGTIEIRHSGLTAGTRAEVIVLVEQPSDDRLATGEGAAETPLWEMAAAAGSCVPAEEWENVPRDLARNLDHYLY